MRPEAEKVKALITELGLGYGHSTFADALKVYAESQLSSNVEAEVSTLRDDGQGLLTKTAIGISKALYQQGGQGGLRTRIYERLRGTNSVNEAGFLNRLLTGSLESTLQEWDGVIVATHYLTGQACRNWRAESESRRLFVIQGDVHALDGYRNPDADGTFIPVEDPVSPLYHQGIPEDRVRKVGFFVHPILLEATEKKDLDVCRERLTEGPLHLGFFLSGAFPQPHKNIIRACLASCKGLLTKGLARATIVPMEDAAFGVSIERFAKSQLSLTTCLDSDTALDEPWQVRVVQSQGTKKEVIRRSHEIASQLDIFASMANERTWPLAMVTFAPNFQIGRPAKENHRWLEERSLVATLHHPERFGKMVEDLMKDDNGWWSQLERRLEKIPTNGVANTWSEILNSG